MLSIARKLTIACTAAAALVGAAHADVYKYTDANGNVQYTDKPPGEAERLNVKAPKADPTTQARLQEAEKNLEKSREERAQKGEDKAAGKITAKDKAERCIKARERYEQYSTSQRLFRERPDGEREYLSDSELTAARNDAKNSMDELCK